MASPRIRSALFTLVRWRPAWLLHQLAGEEEMSAPSLSVASTGSRAGGPAPASTVERRSAPRRPRADTAGPHAHEARPGTPDDLARGAPRRPLRRRAAADRGARCRVECPAGASIVRLLGSPPPAGRSVAPPSPQGPPVLRGPGRLARRHVDAERRAGVARDRAVALGRSRSARSPFAASCRFCCSGSWQGCSSTGSTRAGSWWSRRATAMVVSIGARRGDDRTSRRRCPFVYALAALGGLVLVVDAPG